MTKRVPLTINGHVVGWADIGDPDPYTDYYTRKVTNVELLPDDEIPEEAKPHVRMILAQTLKGLSIDRGTDNPGS